MNQLAFSIRYALILSIGWIIYPSLPTLAQEGQLLQITVHGPSLENNRLGLSTTRETAVYLPPSYQTSPSRRYPVLFILHGITDPITVWTESWDPSNSEFGTIQDLMDRGIAEGLLEEMIVVIPDARTPFYGCHYANSPVKGNWQDFITKDLVDYIDSNYRTRSSASSRGIMGHSMGGHGAIRIGLQHPEIFSVVYGMNPSLMGWGGDVSAENPAFETLLSSSDPTPYFESNFYVPAIIGVSQAFSPNPDNPPFYADYPFRMENGAIVPNPEAFDRWEENFPKSMISDYLADTQRLQGLRFDSAFIDEFSHIPPTTKAFSDALSAQNVPHIFEMYNGDHRNRLWGSSGRLYTEVLPYFSRLLSVN
ncbi:MAG: esterase family protein [Rhodothermaceae bacterium]|nr:esterase family protein [Rhodothermaceae bacterium]